MLSPRHTTLRALSCLLVLGLASACDDSSQREEELSFDPSISRLDVSTGSGDIVVESAAELTKIEVLAEITGPETELRTKIDDGVLYLDHHCPHAWDSCSVTWHVRVPESSTDLHALTLDTGSGDVEVRELEVGVEAHTGSGNIELDAVDGAHFSLDTGSGNVELNACGADNLEGHSGSGDLTLNLARTPRRVELETGSGDIALRLPFAPYALELDTGSGDIDIEGIDSDDQAERRLELSTGSGNLLIRGY